MPTPVSFTDWRISPPINAVAQLRDASIRAYLITMITHEVVTTSNLTFSFEQPMLTKYVSSGNISGAHLGYLNSAPHSSASSNLLGADKSTFWPLL